MFVRWLVLSLHCKMIPSSKLGLFWQEVACCESALLLLLILVTKQGEKRLPNSQFNIKVGIATNTTWYRLQNSESQHSRKAQMSAEKPPPPPHSIYRFYFTWAFIESCRMFHPILCLIRSANAGHFDLLGRFITYVCWCYIVRHNASWW